MKIIRGAVIIIPVLFSLFCQSPESERISELEECILSRINDSRIENGAGALANDEALSDVARDHSEDMYSRDYFSHTTPGGVTFDERIENAGIEFLKAGENIYMRMNPQISEISVDSLGAAVVDAWLASEGHRQIMLDADYDEAGVGCCEGEGILYVTLDVIDAP